MSLKEFSKKSMDELQRLDADAIKNVARHPIAIVLDNVRSMQNVGSAFRTADCLKAEALILSGFTPQPPHRDINKSALGATEVVPWLHFPSANGTIAYLNKNGYRIISIEQVHNSTSLDGVNWSFDKPIALVFGNEVEGVSQSFLDASDAAIEIPQYGAKHSFNISVSIGIVVWEAIKNYLKLL
jgi:23S rRNA (guanosine2251-2'-O)-methyltransferase